MANLRRYSLSVSYSVHGRHFIFTSFSRLSWILGLQFVTTVTPLRPQLQASSLLLPVLYVTRRELFLTFYLTRGIYFFVPTTTPSTFLLASCSVVRYLHLRFPFHNTFYCGVPPCSVSISHRLYRHTLPWPRPHNKTLSSIRSLVAYCYCSLFYCVHSTLLSHSCFFHSVLRLPIEDRIFYTTIPTLAFNSSTLPYLQPHVDGFCRFFCYRLSVRYTYLHTPIVTSSSFKSAPSPGSRPYASRFLFAVHTGSHLGFPSSSEKRTVIVSVCPPTFSPPHSLPLFPPLLSVPDPRSLFFFPVRVSHT